MGRQWTALVVVLLLNAFLGKAFVIVVPGARTTTAATRATSPLYMAGMAQPETTIKTKTVVKQASKQKVETRRKTQYDDPVENRDHDFQDAPMFKVMLLSDESYDSEHVVSRLCAIIEDMDEDQASTVLQQAMSGGKAMCGKYPFERAELFKEQLLRSDPMIFVDLEEENK